RHRPTPTPPGEEIGSTWWNERYAPITSCYPKKTEKPTSQGLMSRRTRRRCRHSARLLARRRSVVRPAAEGVASATCIDQGTPPPPPACATWASSCFASVFSPPARSFTLPACHFSTKFCTRFVYDWPDAMIGDVPECGFAKIFRNVEKRASGV